MKIEITEAQYNVLRDIIGKYEIELFLKFSRKLKEIELIILNHTIEVIILNIRVGQNPNI